MKNIKYVTLEEKIKEVQETEKQIKDKPTTERKLLDLCGYLYSLHKKPYKQVKILSDYDTDGILSAYNMYKFFSGICNVPVKTEINDRRNGYGISDKIIPEKDTLYVVLDMGSNQLDYIDEVLGNDTIIIDHHIIEDEKIKEKFKNEPRLLNLKADLDGSGELPDYCTAGLTKKIIDTYMSRLSVKIDKKDLNAITAMAAIGTCTDCVNLLDIYSTNRFLVRNGIDVINNADENNFNYVLGNFFATCGINTNGKITTAKELAWNIGSMINGASRMSKTFDMNGGQFMFDTLTGKVTPETYVNILKAKEINEKRKEITQTIKKSDELKETVASVKANNDNIVIYILPEDTPETVAGLIASDIVDKTLRPCICVVYDKDADCYKGSGRNMDGFPSLYENVKKALGHTEGFGGHDSAIGISSMSFTDLSKMSKNLSEIYKNITIDSKPVEVFNFNPKGLRGLTDKVLSLEPIGSGNELPLIEVPINGNEKITDLSKKNNNPHWKILDTEYGKMKEWNYEEGMYSSPTSVLAKLEYSNYSGRCELTSDKTLDDYNRLTALQKPVPAKIKAKNEQLGNP